MNDDYPLTILISILSVFFSSHIRPICNQIHFPHQKLQEKISQSKLLLHPTNSLMSSILNLMHLSQTYGVDWFLTLEISQAVLLTNRIISTIPFPFQHRAFYCYYYILLFGCNVLKLVTKNSTFCYRQIQKLSVWFQIGKCQFKYLHSKSFIRLGFLRRTYPNSHCPWDTIRLSQIYSLLTLVKCFWNGLLLLLCFQFMRIYE